MHIPTSWASRFIVEDGHIVLILEAEYETKTDYYSVDVYKERDDKKYWDQNLYVSMWGGVAVAFPGLPRNNRRNSWYYDPSIAEEEGWAERRSYSNVGRYGTPLVNDIELICSIYPEFRYTLNKCTWETWNKAYLMRILQVWKLHPELELLFAAGYENLAMDGNFWRLKECNRKKVVSFLRNNSNETLKRCSYRVLRDVMLSKDPEMYLRYMFEVPSYLRGKDKLFPAGLRFEDFVYLEKLNIKINPRKCRLYIHEDRNLIDFWRDYIYMAERNGHDVFDEYWRHPKNLIEKHDQMLHEEDVRLEAERIAREAAEQKEHEEYIKTHAKQINSLLRRFNAFETEIDGFHIFVTTDYEIWKDQAEKLGQCIIRAGYYQSMLDGKQTLVFIQKDGEPVATAEVKQDGKIGQFYADEHDRTNCLPTDEVREAFNKWLDSVPKSKFKKVTRKKKEVA